MGKQAIHGHKQQDGFTLVEVLVALMVMAVASIGLISATEAYIGSVGKTEDRAIAQWVAENKIAELTISGGQPKPYELVQMMGRAWKVEVVTRPSSDRDLLAHQLLVSAAGSNDPLLKMDFFTSAEVKK